MDVPSHPRFKSNGSGGIPCVPDSTMWSRLKEVKDGVLEGKGRCPPLFLLLSGSWVGKANGSRETMFTRKVSISQMCCHLTRILKGMISWVVLSLEQLNIRQKVCGS